MGVTGPPGQFGNPSSTAPQVSSKLAKDIQPWEVQILDQLSNAGLLNGVNPNDLVGIQVAEQGYGGYNSGVLNSSGIGGFFGESANTPYGPYGGISSGEMVTSSAQSYTAQAQIASYVFAQGLQRSGGNILEAESYYQTGSIHGRSSGDSIFTSLGLTGTESGASPGSSTGGGSSSPPSSGSTGSLTTTPNDMTFFGIDLSQIGRYLAFFLIAIVILIIGGLVMATGAIKRNNPVTSEGI